MLFLDYEDLETEVSGRLLLSYDTTELYIKPWAPQLEPNNTYDPECLWYCSQCILRICGATQKYPFSECRANYKNIKLKVTTVQLIAMVTEAAEKYVVEEVTDIHPAPNTIYVMCQKRVGDAGMWELDMLGSRYLMNDAMMPFFREPTLIICDTFATYYEMQRHGKMLDCGVFSVKPDLQLLEQICTQKENNILSQTITLPIMSMDIFCTPKIDPDQKNQGSTQESRTSQVITLSQREVSVLIGLNGVRLNELRRTSGCVIKVHPADRNSLTSRKHSLQQVLISGPSASIRKTIEAIQLLITAYRTNSTFF